MRVALLAPPFLPCPPQGYGGVELMIAELADHLVDLGLDVTLFAHPGSRTRARHFAYEPPSDDSFNFLDDIRRAREVVSHLVDFDVVHNHSVAPLLVEDAIGDRAFVTTAHNLTKGVAIERHASSKFVSISHSQRTSTPVDVNWVATIYNGVDVARFVPGEGTDGRYLLHIGAITPHKGTDQAIRIARAADVPLVIAGRVSPRDVDYFEESIEPHLDGRSVTFVGEVAGQEKVSLYQGALALLFPIRWPEPFGLVMVEAGACGIPVLATPWGSVPEVVVPGITGFVEEDPDQLARLVAHLGDLSPADCRTHVVERFSSRRMAEDYAALYDRLTGL